jgi:hypothetical protein
MEMASRSGAWCASAPGKVCDGDEDDCAECCDGDTAKESNRSAESEKFEGDLTDERSDQPNYHVCDAAEASPPREQPGDPTRDNTNQDPREQAAWFEGEQSYATS